MRKFRKHAGLVAGLLALSLVAAACGGDDDPPAGNGTTEPTEPASRGLDHDLGFVDRRADLVDRR